MEADRPYNKWVVRAWDALVSLAIVDLTDPRPESPMSRPESPMRRLPQHSPPPPLPVLCVAPPVERAAPPPAQPVSVQVQQFLAWRTQQGDAENMRDSAATLLRRMLARLGMQHLTPLLLDVLPLACDATEEPDVVLHVRAMELGGGELQVRTTGGAFCGVVQLGGTDQHGVTLGAATNHVVGFMDAATGLPTLTFSAVVGPRSFPLTASGVFMCAGGVAPVRFTTDTRWNDIYLPIADGLVKNEPRAYDAFDLPPISIATPSALTGAELRIALAAAGRTLPDNLLAEAFGRQARPSVSGDIDRRAWQNVIHWLLPKYATWSSAPLPPVGASVQLDKSGHICVRGSQLCVVEPGKLAWSAHPGADVSAAPSTPVSWRVVPTPTPQLVTALRTRYDAAVATLRPVEIARMTALLGALGHTAPPFKMPPLTAVRAALQSGTAEQILAAVRADAALKTTPDTLQRRLGLLVHAVGPTAFYASYTAQREVLLAWATALRADVVNTTSLDKSITATTARGDTLMLNTDPDAFPRLGSPPVESSASPSDITAVFMAAGAAAGAWDITTFAHPLSAITHALVQLDALGVLRASPPPPAPPPPFILNANTILRNLPTTDAVEIVPFSTLEVSTAPGTVLAVRELDTGRAHSVGGANGAGMARLHTQGPANAQLLCATRVGWQPVAPLHIAYTATSHIEWGIFSDPELNIEASPVGPVVLAHDMLLHMAPTNETDPGRRADQSVCCTGGSACLQLPDGSQTPIEIIAAARGWRFRAAGASHAALGAYLCEMVRSKRQHAVHPQLHIFAADHTASREVDVSELLASGSIPRDVHGLERELALPSHHPSESAQARLLFINNCAATAPLRLGELAAVLSRQQMVGSPPRRERSTIVPATTTAALLTEFPPLCSFPYKNTSSCCGFPARAPLQSDGSEETATEEVCALLDKVTDPQEPTKPMWHTFIRLPGVMDALRSDEKIPACWLGDTCHMGHIIMQLPSTVPLQLHTGVTHVMDGTVLSWPGSNAASGLVCNVGVLMFKAEYMLAQNDLRLEHAAVVDGVVVLQPIESENNVRVWTPPADVDNPHRAALMAWRSIKKDGKKSHVTHAFMLWEGSAIAVHSINAPGSEHELVVAGGALAFKCDGLLPTILSLRLPESINAASLVREWGTGLRACDMFGAVARALPPFTHAPLDDNTPVLGLRCNEQRGAFLRQRVIEAPTAAQLGASTPLLLFGYDPAEAQPWSVHPRWHPLVSSPPYIAWLRSALCSSTIAYARLAPTPNQPRDMTMLALDGAGRPPPPASVWTSTSLQDTHLRIQMGSGYSYALHTTEVHPNGSVTVGIYPQGDVEATGWCSLAALPDTTVRLPPLLNHILTIFSAPRHPAALTLPAFLRYCTMSPAVGSAPPLLTTPYGTVSLAPFHLPSHLFSDSAAPLPTTANWTSLTAALAAAANCEEALPLMQQLNSVELPPPGFARETDLSFLNDLVYNALDERASEHPDIVAAFLVLCNKCAQG